MNVLIIGGTNFIGPVLSRELLKQSIRSSYFLVPQEIILKNARMFRVIAGMFWIDEVPLKNPDPM